MLILPKVNKENPGLSVARKLKTVVASLLVTSTMAVSGLAYADNSIVGNVSEGASELRTTRAEQSTPLLMVQHERQNGGVAYHYSHSSHSSHYSHSSHSSHYSHYSGRM